MRKTVHFLCINYEPYAMTLINMRCAAPFSSHAFSSRVCSTLNRFVSGLILIIIVTCVYLERISYLIFHVAYFLCSCIWSSYNKHETKYIPYVKLIFIEKSASTSTNDSAGNSLLLGADWSIPPCTVYK